MNGHRALSSRECGNIETAVSRICLAMGRSEKDSDLRQAAWTAILSGYRKNPEGFLGCHTWGWQQAYRLAGEAIADELRFRRQHSYRNRSLDQPLPGNPDGTLHQLLPSSSGLEDRVCFYDYLTRLHPDVQHLAYGILNGETLEEVQGHSLWSHGHARWAFRQLQQDLRRYRRI